MDAGRFDALSRSLLVAGSRRSALTLALSGVLGVFGHDHPDEVDAHDALRACKKIKDPEKARACVRRAKNHGRRHCRHCPTPANSCQAATCSIRTGACRVVNRPAGFSCEDGLFCNGAETCDGHGNCLPGIPPCDDGRCTTRDICIEAERRCHHEQMDVCV